MKHRLTRRLVLYFAVALLIFSLLIGVVFTILFARYTRALNTEDLRMRAVNLAAAMTWMPETRRLFPSASWGDHWHAADDSSRPHTWGRHNYSEQETDGEHSRSGWYLKRLRDLSHSGVWLVDTNAHNINTYGQSGDSTISDMPPQAEKILDQVLAGDTCMSEDFTSMLGTPTVTAGTPVRDADGNIIGALLLHRTIREMEQAQQGGMIIMGIALCLAFLLSVLISMLLARRFSRPLYRMKETAAALTEGQYEARTRIQQQDEIGMLAQSLDTLGERLAEAERSRQAVQSQRQEFLANISHELRTPLTVLRGFLEVLESGLVQDEDKKKGYLDKMSSTVLDLQRLVGDLLELTRLQNPSFRMEKEMVNLCDALRDAMDNARPLAAAKQVIITEQLPEMIAWPADYGRIRQMFLTILDNAVKFSPTRGLIRVYGKKTADSWQIGIEDHGCGISAEELPHIFERFHTNRDRINPNGTGLGLPIAREIARCHDIFISCNSEPGTGTCFEFQGRKKA